MKKSITYRNIKYYITYKFCMIKQLCQIMYYCPKLFKIFPIDAFYNFKDEEAIIDINSEIGEYYKNQINSNKPDWVCIRSDKLRKFDVYSINRFNKNEILPRFIKYKYVSNIIIKNDGSIVLFNKKRDSVKYPANVK